MKSIDWLKHRRAITWYLGGRFFAPRGVVGPKRTTRERIQKEKDWDRVFKERNSGG